MNTRSNDVLFMVEYVKDVLSFATVRQGKVLRSTSDAHYFSIDDELVYQNYYADFGPLNLGCVYKYCKKVDQKIKECLNKHVVIVHYTSIEPRKKANAAYLLACYGVLFLSLNPRDAIKPLMVHGQTYRPFQDATQGDSMYTITIMDCLFAIQKARVLGFFNFQDFDYESYDFYDRMEGGDLNWIVPGKFLAFIGPVDPISHYNERSLYPPPEKYIEHFLENNVKIVIRLNKKLYEGRVFHDVGIVHYDLYFPDGSLPPRHILFKFLQIAEDSDDALAVHCKAGLGRTGSLIGCYLIKHYRMTSHEAIAWMRICRPGSVIGHQQGWLEQLEPWLIKQGNIYRKRKYKDTERFPVHEFGVYSTAERRMRASKMRTILIDKSPSPPPPMHRMSTRSEINPPLRPQVSKVRPANYKAVEKDQDVNAKISRWNHSPKIEYKGDYAENKSRPIRHAHGGGELHVPRHSERSVSRQRGPPKPNVPSTRNFTNYSPITTFRSTQGPIIKTLHDARNFLMRATIGKSDRDQPQKTPAMITSQFSHRATNYTSESKQNIPRHQPSMFNTGTRDREPSHIPVQTRRRLGRSPSPPPPQSRRSTEQTRLLPPSSNAMEKIVKDSSKYALRDALSRLQLSCPRDASLGGVSVGAGSLGARRDAPAPRRAPSVRSDERACATQGDMLNSIKFQRRFRDSLQSDQQLKSCSFNNKPGYSLIPTRELPSVRPSQSVRPMPYTRPVSSKMGAVRPSYISPAVPIRQSLSVKPANTRSTRRLGASPDNRDRSPSPPMRGPYSPARPSSPKPRRRMDSPY